MNNKTSVTTGFIPVEEGENIIVSIAYTNWTEIGRRTVSFRICGYDSNKEFVSNSYKDSVSSYAIPEGMNYVRITLNNTSLSSDYRCQIENSTIPTYYQEYFEPYYSDIKPAEWKTNIEEYTDIAYLPPEIYVAQGTSISLYNNQICPISTDDYVFNWSCDSNIGESTSAYNGNFSINTNVNTGNYTLSLTINDGNSNVWSGNTTIKVVNNEINKNISLLCIGDSLTNGKPWLSSLVTLSNNKIQLLGTRGSSNILHEGRSGFTSAQYLKNTAYEEETSHAFYNQATNRFDWNYYKSTTGNNPDQIVLFLGTNGILTDPTGNANCIKQIIDYIRQDDQNIPIYVVNTLYGGTGEYDENIKVFNLMVRLHQLLDEYDNLTFVPLAITHDSVTNFEGQTDKVHPNSNGYTQFANTIYSAICGYNNK